MIYQPMVVRDYKSGEELKAAYTKTHRKLFDQATKEVSDQLVVDQKVITLLRDHVQRQFAEISSLVTQSVEYQARIDELHAGFLLKKEEYERIAAQRKMIDATIHKDTAIVSFQTVLKAVCHVYDLAPAVVKGRSKDKQAVTARWHIVHILTVMRPDLSLPLIGRLLGGRDHATIMHARRQWPKIAGNFEKQSEALDKILGSLKPVDSAHNPLIDQQVSLCGDKIAACG